MYFAPPSKVLPWRLRENPKGWGGESGWGLEAGQLPLLLEVELEPRLGILLGKKPTPHTGEKVPGQHPQPRPPTDVLEHTRLLLTPPPPNSPIWVTHQVTKFYGGHGCLEDGPETPKEMGCQGIPEGQGKQGFRVREALLDPKALISAPLPDPPLS